MMKSTSTIICMFLLLLVIMLVRINQSIRHQTNLHLCIEMAKMGELCAYRGEDADSEQPTLKHLPGEVT